MNNQDKKKSCAYCGEVKDEIEVQFTDGWDLCWSCASEYENKTGHCSLHCCMNGQCDESC